MVCCFCLQHLEDPGEQGKLHDRGEVGSSRHVLGRIIVVNLWVCSSAGEHYVDIVGVTSSILVIPTNKKTAGLVSAVFLLKSNMYKERTCETSSERIVAES